MKKNKYQILNQIAENATHPEANAEKLKKIHAAMTQQQTVKKQKSPIVWKVWSFASTGVCCALCIALLTITLMPKPQLPQEVYYSNSDVIEQKLELENIPQYYPISYEVEGMAIDWASAFIGPMEKKSGICFVYQYTEFPFNLIMPDALRVSVITDKHYIYNSQNQFVTCKEKTLVDSVNVLYNEIELNEEVMISYSKFDWNGYKYFVEYQYLNETENIQGKAIERIVADIIK